MNPDNSGKILAKALAELGDIIGMLYAENYHQVVGGERRARSVMDRVDAIKRELGNAALLTDD